MANKQWSHDWWNTSKTWGISGGNKWQCGSKWESQADASQEWQSKGKWQQETDDSHVWRTMNKRRKVEMVEEVRDYYHGTHIEAVASIMAQGFRPCFGAGSDVLAKHYGLPVPGVYVATNFKTASTYPIYATTGPVKIPGQNKKS